MKRKNKAAVALGRKGGLARSLAKTMACRANALKRWAKPCPQCGRPLDVVAISNGRWLASCSGHCSEAEADSLLSGSGATAKLAVADFLDKAGRGCCAGHPDGLRYASAALPAPCSVSTPGKVETAEIGSGAS